MIDCGSVGTVVVCLVPGMAVLVWWLYGESRDSYDNTGIGYMVLRLVTSVAVLTRNVIRNSWSCNEHGKLS